MRISAIRSNNQSFGKFFKKKNQEGEENKKSSGKTAVKTAVALTAISGSALMLSGHIPPNSVTMPYNPNVTDVSQVAEAFGVDENAIIINEESFEMIIPKKFDYLQDRIDAQRDRIYGTVISPQTVARDGYKKIQQLMEKQEFQKHVATMSTDDKYVYFTVFPDENQQDSFITIEDFKKVFDIREGALSAIEENGIADDVTGEYFTDGREYLTAGDQVKVKVSGIDKYNINFDYK